MFGLLRSRFSGNEELEKRYPPEGAFLHLRGWDMHYLSHGRGPDLVLLHGAGGSMRDMTFRLMRHLSTRFRVTAIDRPGHGWTVGDHPQDVVSPGEQALLLWDLLDRLGLQNPVILGQSYGGSVALAMALCRPGAAKGYCFVSAATMPMLGDIEIGAGWASDLIANCATRAFSSEIGRRHIDNAIRKLFDPEPVPDGYIAHFGPELTLRPETLHHLSLQVMSLNGSLRHMSDLIPSIREPVQIIHGAGDRILRVEQHALPLAGRIPGSKAHVLRGAGHMPHQTHPEDILQACLDISAR